MPRIQSPVASLAQIRVTGSYYVVRERWQANSSNHLHLSVRGPRGGMAAKCGRRGRDWSIETWELPIYVVNRWREAALRNMLCPDCFADFPYLLIFRDR